MKEKRKAKNNILREKDEERRYRWLAYANFQYLCFHEELLHNESLKRLYEELLEFFVERTRATSGNPDFNENDAIALAKEMNNYYETIKAPESERDVLEFEKSFDKNKHLLVIKVIPSKKYFKLR